MHADGHAPLAVPCHVTGAPPACLLPICVAADGWGFSSLGNNPMGPSPNALKYQVIGMLHAAAYMRGECRRQGGGWAGRVERFEARFSEDAL